MRLSEMSTGAKVGAGVAVVVVVGVGVAAALGLFNKGPLTTAANLPWPAPVVQIPAQPPVLKPEDAIKTITMAPGYHLELVAHEPIVKDPILMEFDGDGRLWVMEMPAFAHNEKMDDDEAPVNDIVILEDKDHDGIYETRTVFIDKLILPRAFRILDKNCALIGEPPHVWKACDTNGDGKADTKELVTDGFGAQGILEHGANGLYWAMDNTIRVSEHTWNLVRDGDKFEKVRTLNRGQWGVTQDNAGRVYRNVNTDPLFTDIVADKYYMRNPNQIRTRGLYETLTRQEDSMIWPAKATRGVNRGYRDESFRSDNSATYYQGVSSPLIYRGDRLPADIQNQAFVTDGPTNIVHLLKMHDDNGQLLATDFYKKGEFLASTDERFRPVQVVQGYDGTVYVLDMYRGVSQDGPIQTEYLRDYIKQHRLWEGTGYGRIWRVVYDGMKPDVKPNMSAETPAQLVAHLSHPSGWWRDTAQRLIIQRNDKSVVPALKDLAVNAPEWTTRIQALWTLDGLGASDQATVSRALADKQPEVRATAVRLSEHWIASDAALQTTVAKLIDDANWQVRRQVAATLGEMPAEARLAPLVSVLSKYGNDPITVDIAISSLTGQEEAALTALLAQGNAPADAVGQLIGTASRSRDIAVVQRMITLGTDTKQPEAVRLAALQGVSTGLQGGARRGGGVAGGRAGGGAGFGAFARRPGGNRLELPSKPALLISLSSGEGAAANAAKQLSDLLGWPGKPLPPAVAPRSPEEEALFQAGEKIYAMQCIGCHMSQGQGAPHVAAPLAGSRYVNAGGDLAVRILTAGKDGTIGDMPPLGQQLSDEQLASVLTYVRASFGNTAAPLAPAQVKEWRQQFAFRKTPWKEQEIAQLYERSQRQRQPQQQATRP